MVTLYKKLLELFKVETQIDVYKRQVQQRVEQSPVGGSVPLSPDFLYTYIISVSYTHLDVYKRQTLSRSDKSTSISTQLDSLIPASKISTLTQGMGNGRFGICEPRYAVLFPRHR